MDVIYSLVPAMILLALVSVVIFFWAARSGQYDDMEGPAHRILTDDDDPMLPEGHRRETAENEAATPKAGDRDTQDSSIQHTSDNGD